MTTHVIEVSGVSKKYCRDHRLGHALANIGRELRDAGGSGALRAHEFWALDDVSFTLDPGGALAVLGHNGAGKSSLLKSDRGEIRHAALLASAGLKLGRILRCGRRASRTEAESA